jgi:hypothetical protein
MTELEKNYLEIVRLIHSFSNDVDRFTGPLGTRHSETIDLACIDAFMSEFYRCIDYDVVSRTSGKSITSESSEQLDLDFSGGDCQRVIDPYDLDYQTD